MKSLFIGVFIILFSLKSNNCNYNNTETLFLGYEKMEGYIDDRKPEYQWFRKTLIKFKNDSVFIDQSPISINKNDTLKSESDGGFYYYKGIKNETANQIKISTKEISCDFCPTEVKRNSNGENVKVKREKNLVAKRVGNNLQIGNDVYKKVKIGKLKLRSEFLK